MSSALVFRGPWDISLEGRPIPALDSANDVLVRVRATGVCGTDIGIVRGSYAATPGVALGHEGAGEIAAVGDRVRSVEVGTRVVIDPTYACGHCAMCRSERPNHCEYKSVREAGVSCDGAFATYYVTDERFVHRIQDDLSFQEASLTEPLSCVLTGLNQLRLRADQDVLVLGGGPMGMLYAFALAARGLKGTLVECAGARRALCLERLPQGWTTTAEARPLRESLDLIVDTAGNALPWGIDALRRGGQILLTSLSGGFARLAPSELTNRSLSLIGSIDSIGTFALALHMIESGIVPARQLVTHVLPLDQFEKGFDAVGLDIRRRERIIDNIQALKVVLVS